MIRRAASLAILLVSLASPASADAGGEALLRAFIDYVDASPTWSASADIRSEGEDTIAEGLVFSLSDADASMSIEQLRLTALRKGDGNGFTASAIQVAGLALSFSADFEDAPQTVEYSVPSASVRDVVVPSSSELVFDMQHPMRSIGEFYTLISETEFREFKVPELIGEQKISTQSEGTTTNTFVYRNMSMAGMSGGILGRTEAGPISFDIVLPEGEGSMQFEIEQVTAGEMDFGAMARILDPRAYEGGRGDGVWRPIVSDVAYSGFTGTGPDGATFQLGSITLSNLDGRQTEEPFSNAFDRLFDTSIATEEKDEAVLKAVLSLYSAWRLGAIEMVGLSVSVPNQPVSFELGGLSLSGISNEALASLAMSNLRGAGPGGFGTLNKLELREFVFPDLQALIELGEKAGESEGSASTADVRAIMAAMPRFSHFGLHGVAGGPNPADAVTIGSFTIDIGEWGGILAGTTETRLVDLYIPRELLLRDPKTAEPFRALGFERLVLGMSATSDWSASEGTYELTLAATVENGAEVEISCTVTGMTDAWIDQLIVAGQGEDSDAATTALVGQLSLVRAGVTVADDSLVDRAFNAAIVAQNLNVDAATYKQQTRDAVPFLLSTVVPPQLVERIGVPVQTFLEGRRTLVVEISPPEPILLQDIMSRLADPIPLIDALQLAITAQ